MGKYMMKRLYTLFDNNETKNYGFALLKPLKKHLKGSDT